jgi:CRISPR/Cas system CSM-associated protein Csm5 (group 7 of RAMP superfamily)
VLDEEAKADEAKVSAALKEAAIMSKNEEKAARNPPKSEKALQKLKAAEVKVEKRLSEIKAAYEKAVLEREKAESKLEVRCPIKQPVQVFCPGWI